MTLAWDPEDFGKLLASPADPDGPGYQFFDLPNANYGSSNYDSIVDSDDNVIGLSLFTGYAVNERTSTLAGDDQPGRPARSRGARHLGRARRWQPKDDRPAARAACRSCDRQPGPVLEDGPRDLPSRLAHGGRRELTQPSASTARGMGCVRYFGWRRRKRWILPVWVLGRASVNTIERGYLKGAIAAFTWSCSAAIVASDGSTPSASTTWACTI